MCPCTGQPYLGQVVWAVDADAVNEGRGVSCGGRRGVSLCRIELDAQLLKMN